LALAHRAEADYDAAKGRLGIMVSPVMPDRLENH
jgi:hypothetical protein